MRKFFQKILIVTLLAVTAWMWSGQGRAFGAAPYPNCPVHHKYFLPLVRSEGPQLPATIIIYNTTEIPDY
jgi:hypothetical protein